jgi:hypothetical protein
LGRQKSTLKPLDEEGEDVTQSAVRGYEHGQGHGYGYGYRYQDGQDEQGRSPYTNTTPGTGYDYPPGPYPFGAQARSQALPPLRTPAWRLVDPSRRQGSRGCLMWTKKGGIIDLVLGRRITWEVSEVGRGRSMERKRGRVWSEVRLIRLGRRSWRVSGYGRLGDRLVISGLRQGSAVLIPSGRPVLLLTAHAHNHKHDPTSSSYPPSIDSRIDNSAPGSPKWYEKLLGIGQGEYPIEQQIENKRRGLGRQRWPYACWVLTLGEL